MPFALRVPQQLNDLVVDVGLNSNPSQGSILYKGASKWNDLAAGGANTYLKSDGSGGLSWATVDLSAYLPLTGGTLTGALVINPSFGFTGNILNLQVGGTQKIAVDHEGYLTNPSNALRLKHASSGVYAQMNAGGDEGYGEIEFSGRGKVSGGFSRMKISHPDDIMLSPADVLAIYPGAQSVSFSGQWDLSWNNYGVTISKRWVSAWSGSTVNDESQDAICARPSSTLSTYWRPLALYGYNHNHPLVSVDSVGKLCFGSGSATADTNLYRSAADLLKTDDGFHVAGTPTATANYGLFSVGHGNFSGGSGGFVGSANGTVFGLNVPTAYTGDLINVQNNGTNRLKLTKSGAFTVNCDGTDATSFAFQINGGSGLSMNQYGIIYTGTLYSSDFNPTSMYGHPSGTWTAAGKIVSNWNGAATNTNAQDSIRIQPSSTLSTYWRPLAIYTSSGASTPAVSISSTGNMGIRSTPSSTNENILIVEGVGSSTFNVATFKCAGYPTYATIHSEYGSAESEAVLRLGAGVGGWTPNYAYVGWKYSSHFYVSTNSTAHALLIKNSGEVGIGTSTSINASAKVQIDSTTQGFLPPRMTETQRDAISSPAAGLVAYNSDDNKLNVYDGTSWREISLV